MLPSQRALFDMPRDVCFMNAAAWSPLPLASQEAGRAAVGRKGQPWKLPDGFSRGLYQMDYRHRVGRQIAMDIVEGLERGTA